MEKKTSRKIIILSSISACIVVATIAVHVFDRAQKKNVTIDNVTFHVEVASTDAEREKGLQGRESLATDAGMLFTFDAPSKPSFWMKGVNFNLDFIWIRNGKIVEFTHNAHAVASSMPDDKVVRFTPREDVDSVLEVPSGTIDANRFFIGDRVEIK